MNFPLPIFVGFDPREAACYHVFCQSVLARASVPVSFTPLHAPTIANFDGQKDGSNAFIYSRFLVPHLMGYSGWAIFCDGDMVVLDDIAKLWAERENHTFDKAVAVVKHDYKTKRSRKYIGTPMEAANADYPRKNWSSVMLWNCGHYANRRLTPELVTESPGSFLHRFQWLDDRQIGALAPEWNVLVGEQDTAGASLLHYTHGAPGFSHYANCDASEHWRRALKKATHMENS
jgi:lipopolysaccharide biosynthesis glycosyltransferase